MAHISQLRGQGSFRRRHGNRKPKPITLVICEGDTERAYFEAARIHFGLSTAEVVVAESDKGSAPTSVVKCAERRSSERGGYDQIYCVFDRDQHASFRVAREKIAKLASRQHKGLRIAEAVSIPCFEFWMLLHFERTDASFVSCANVVRHLRNQHIPNYQKADADLCKQLMTKLGDALANADWVETRAAINKHDPYTSAHSVMRHFMAIAQNQGTP